MSKSKLIWKGKPENLPKEYADEIIKVYNERVDWWTEHHPQEKEKNPERFHKITEPFETYPWIKPRPYIALESEFADIDYNKEVIWEMFCINEEKELYLCFKSKISRQYYETYGEKYEMTGKVEVIQF